MGDPVIIPTEGSIDLALAGRKAEFKLGEGVKLAGRRDEDSRAIPDGVCRLTIASEPGYLHLTEVEPGVYELAMGDPPEAAPEPVPGPVTMDEHEVRIAELVKERDALAAEKSILVYEKAALAAEVATLEAAVAEAVPADEALPTDVKGGMIRG